LDGLLAYVLSARKNRSINVEEIRELLRRDPFEPFRFHLTSGDRHKVRDPNSVALGGRRVFIAEPATDRLVFCPYLHIAAIETLAQGRLRTRRGRRR
jgi:hypothetical protein